MSTKQTKQKMKAAAEAARNDATGEDDNDDVGALIYREVQLRKAESAAKKSENTSTASVHQRRTSTRKRTPVHNQSREPLPSGQQHSGASKRMKRGSSDEDNRLEKRVAKKKYRYECSADGCKNIAQKGGVCIRHGAKIKRCSSKGCTNQAQKGGVCIRHGAKVKRCSSEGCTNYPYKGGVCKRHGAKVKRSVCSKEGCTNIVVKGGVCVRHGAKVKRCSSEGCTNIAVKGGVCVRHGAKVKRCGIEECTNYAQKGGVCKRHGTYRTNNDESTAFGPEFETTTARSPPNQRASRSTGREGQVGDNVPVEVAILCQEILEV